MTRAFCTCADEGRHSFEFACNVKQTHWALVIELTKDQKVCLFTYTNVSAGV